MEAAHLGSGNRICTVVFVDIVRYGEELVSKQVEMKAQFAAFLATFTTRVRVVPITSVRPLGHNTSRVP